MKKDYNMLEQQLQNISDELEILKFQVPWSEKHKVIELKEKSQTLILSLQTTNEEELKEIKKSAKEFIGVTVEVIDQIKNLVTKE